MAGYKITSLFITIIIFSFAKIGFCPIGCYEISSLLIMSSV